MDYPLLRDKWNGWTLMKAGGAAKENKQGKSLKEEKGRDQHGVKKAGDVPRSNIPKIHKYCAEGGVLSRD